MKRTEDSLRELCDLERSLTFQLDAVRMKIEKMRKKEQSSKEVSQRKESLGFVASMTPHEITRYSRQVLVPHFGVKAQLSLRNLKVLIVGCGGLGAPVLQYIAAAGVGQIGLVDGDVVEISNLHRQVCHSMETIGLPKVDSAAIFVNRLNDLVKTVSYFQRLSPQNAEAIIKDWDIIADCTDNVATRYLLSDVCCLLNKTLVSGSALGTYGQITVYHHRDDDSGETGPCFRCLFPTPPPPETVGSCADNGVLGPITGIVGSIQAMEILKIGSGKASKDDILTRRMVIIDGWNSSFRVVRLRSRSPSCPICSESISPSGKDLLSVVDQFCSATDKFSEPSSGDRVARDPEPSISEVSCLTLYEKLREPSFNQEAVLIDVRDEIQFDICSIPGSMNFPLETLGARVAEISRLQNSNSEGTPSTPCRSLYLICRRGRSSRKAIHLLKAQGFCDLFNVRGGLSLWKEEIDPDFPLY